MRFDSDTGFLIGQIQILFISRSDRSDPDQLSPDPQTC